MDSFSLFSLFPLATLLVPFSHGSIRSPLMSKTQNGATYQAIFFSPLYLSYIFLSPLSNLSIHCQHIVSNP
ncbi:hypothetical protein AMTRI_Chr07g76760 [Amborella trichopoda]